MPEILVADPGDLNQCGWLPVKTESLAGILEAVHNARNLTEQYPGAVGAGGHHQFFQFRSPVGLALSPQQHFIKAGLDRASRQVDGPLAHRRRHLVEGQPIAQERLLGDLHGYLVGPHVGEISVGDAWQRENVVSDSFPKFLERPLLGRAGNRDFHHNRRQLQESDDRFFGFLGKRVDGVDLVLNLVQDPGVVRIEEQFHVGRAMPFAGNRVQLLDPGDAFEALFDPRADAGLDLFGRSAQVGHADADDGDFNVGVHLHWNAEQRGQPRNHCESHEQIGRHRVGGEPSDHPLH